MKVILFGATGMVGQGVLRECLLDPDVERVLAVSRTPLAQQHAKLQVLVHGDFTDFTAVEAQLAGYDACFFCLGVSSLGLNEVAYTRVTYDMPLAAARTLARLSPAMTFVHTSGASADSTERGKTMWARVKGKAENAILALPFRGKYVFRPGIIQPMNGITSRTRLYRVLYVLLSPLVPLFKRLFPGFVTTTQQVGRAMIIVARQGWARPLLENADINQVR